MGWVDGVVVRQSSMELMSLVLCRPKSNHPQQTPRTPKLTNPPPKNQVREGVEEGGGHGADPLRGADAHARAEVLPKGKFNGHWSWLMGLLAWTACVHVCMGGRGGRFVGCVENNQLTDPSTHIHTAAHKIVTAAQAHGAGRVAGGGAGGHGGGRLGLRGTLVC